MMLMMDGKLLTVNLLLCFLRNQCIKDLGLEPGDADGREEETTEEIKTFMVKAASVAMRCMLDEGQLFSWDGIRTFSEAVVEEVNR